MTDIAGAATHRRFLSRPSEENSYSQANEGDAFSVTEGGISPQSDSKEAGIEYAKAIRAAGSSTRAYRLICRRTGVSLKARNGPRTSESFERPH
jgi:hypothetical protein